MDEFIKAFTVILLGIAGIFFFVILSTLMGALSGWVVGLVFGDTILGILDKLGISGISMFDFGAFMGFVGGFMKTKVTVDVKK